PVPRAALRERGERQGAPAAGFLGDAVKRGGGEQARHGEPGAPGGTAEGVEQRVRQGNGRATHAPVLRREDVELVALRDGDRLDRDQLAVERPGSDEDQGRQGKRAGGTTPRNGAGDGHGDLARDIRKAFKEEYPQRRPDRHTLRGPRRPHLRGVAATGESCSTLNRPGP